MALRNQKALYGSADDIKMFSRKLYSSDPSKATKNPDPNFPNYLMGDFGYGKNGIKIFQLQKNGLIHSIIEYKVNVHMRLRNHKECYEADNSNVIGSDVMETTAYIHAQKYGLRTPEEYALSLAQYLLDAYQVAIESNVVIEVMGWDRLGEHEKQGIYKDKPHNHAFLLNMNGRRRCEVVCKRDDPNPLLIGGISELRVIKTAKAPFVGYVKGLLYTEGDNHDRIMSIDVNAKWEYKTVDGIDFNTHWYRVRDLILHSFAGDSVESKSITTSVQYFAYSAELAVLEAMPEICSVSINLKNIPQVPYDFSRFPPFEPKADVVIVQPCDDPHSAVYIQTDRLENSKL